MNRGINDNADLPQSFLEEIFDDILKNEIRMRDSARVVRGTVYGAGTYVSGTVSLQKGEGRNFVEVGLWKWCVCQESVQCLSVCLSAFRCECVCACM